MKYEAEKKEFVEGFLFIFDERTGELELVETEDKSSEETEADLCCENDIVQE